MSANEKKLTILIATILLITGVPEPIPRTIILTSYQMIFLWKIILMIFVGIMGAEIIFKKFPDFVRKISVPARPITKLCRLPDDIGSILISSAFAPIVTANSVLLTQYKEGKLTESQVVSVAILNTAPAYLRRILTFALPAFLPLFGWLFFIGVVVCNLLVVAAKIIFCIVYSRINTKKSCKNNLDNIKEKECKNQSISFRKPMRMFWGITKKMLIITFSIFFLDNIGILDKTIIPLLGCVMSLLNLPELFSLPLVAFSTGSIPAGAAAFGKMMLDGSLTIKEIFVGVSLGMIVSQPAIIIRHVIPSYLPIFGTKLTSKILGISFGIVLLVRIATFFILKLTLM